VSKIEYVDTCRAQRLAVALTIGAAFATMAMPTVTQAAETATLSLIAAPTVSVITASVRHVVMTTIVTGSLVPREEVQVGVTQWLSYHRDKGRRGRHGESRTNPCPPFDRYI
jgi:hypothetical protein